MAKLREWSQQAAGQPNEQYSPAVYFPWAAILHNIGPGTVDESGNFSPTAFDDYDDFFGLDADGTFNIAAELYFLRTENGENPFTGVKAYDPDTDIRRVRDAINKLGREIDRRRSDRAIKDAVQVAKVQAESLLGDDKIDAMIAAESDRQYTDYLASKSNVLRDLWIGGGLMVSNTIADLALLEDSFNRNIASLAAKARLAREDQRATFAMHLVDLHITQSDQNVSLYQTYLAAAIDALKASTTAKQDEIDKNLEYLQAFKFWNIELLQMALNANSAIYGAQMQARAQTKGERLTAALTNSASMGVQAGMAMGSPAAGLAFGGLNFLAQTLLQ